MPSASCAVEHARSRTKLDRSTRVGPGRAEAFLMSFGCAFIRRQVFNLIGQVDVTMQHGVDLDWFLRCREQKVPIATIDDVVLLYRRHERNMTRNFVAGRDGLMRTVKAVAGCRRRKNNMASGITSRLGEPWPR